MGWGSTKYMALSTLPRYMQSIIFFTATYPQGLKAHVYCNPKRGG